MPRAPIRKTYSKKPLKKRDSRDVVNALFAQNLQKREICTIGITQKVTRKPGKIQLKQLPPPDKFHHLIQDSLERSCPFDDTFDKLLKSANVSPKNTELDINHVKSHNESEKELQYKNALDESITNSLFIEKESEHKKKVEESTLSSFSFQNNSNLPRDICADNCSIEQSYNKKFGEVHKRYIIASTPAICSTPTKQISIVHETISPISSPIISDDVDKAIVDKSYDVIHTWNFQPPKEFQRPHSVSCFGTPKVPRRNGLFKAKNKIKHARKKICLPTSRLRVGTEYSQENDEKLELEPKVALTSLFLNTLGITSSVQMPTRTDESLSKDSNFVSAPTSVSRCMTEKKDENELSPSVMSQRRSSNPTPIRYLHLRKRVVPVTGKRQKVRRKICDTSEFSMEEESHNLRTNDNSTKLTNNYHDSEEKDLEEFRKESETERIENANQSSSLFINTSAIIPDTGKNDLLSSSEENCQSIYNHQLDSICRRSMPNIKHQVLPKSDEQTTEKNRWTINVTSDIINATNVNSFTSQLETRKGNFVRKLNFYVNSPKGSNSDISNSNIVESSVDNAVDLQNYCLQSITEANATSSTKISLCNIPNTEETEISVDKNSSGKKTDSFDEVNESSKRSIILDHSYCGTDTSNVSEHFHQVSNVISVYNSEDEDGVICISDEENLESTSDEGTGELDGKDVILLDSSDEQNIESDVESSFNDTAALDGHIVNGAELSNQIENTDDSNISDNTNSGYDVEENLDQSVNSSIELSNLVNNTHGSNMCDNASPRWVRYNSIDDIEQTVNHARNCSTGHLITPSAEMHNENHSLYDAEEEDKCNDIFNSHFSTNKSVILKDGKSWRRSLLQLRKNSNLYACEDSCTTRKTCGKIQWQSTPFRKSMLSTLRNSTLFDLSVPYISIGS